MRKYLLDAIRVVSSRPLFVLLTSIATIWIFSEELKYYIVVGFILSLFIIPIIYGRLTEIATDKKLSPLAQVFEDNCFNYYAVVILFALPTLIFIFFFQQKFTSPTGLVVAGVIATLMDVAKLFAMPLVFLRRQGITVISLGIKLLLKNVSYSVPLILLVFLMRAIKLLTRIYAPYVMTFPFRAFPRILAPYFSEANTLVIAFFMGLVHNLVVCFIDFVIFVTVVNMLTYDPFLRGNLQDAAADATSAAP